MITIEQLNKWQDIIRDYHNEPIPMEELVEKCNEEGLAEVNSYLIANNYIARMKDGNTWINWSKNRFYEDATIINLKAKLTNSTRPLTLEERMEVLEKRMDELITRLNSIEEKQK
jgi:hypothetical protein